MTLQWQPYFCSASNSGERHYARRAARESTTPARHLVRPTQRRHLLAPHPVVPLRLVPGLPDPPPAARHLLVGARRLAVELERELRHVAHQEGEDLIQQVVWDLVDRRVLEDQLGVYDERENLAAGQEERHVLHLIGAGRIAGEEFAEDFGLPGEACDVREVHALECFPVVVELDLAEALGAALME